jgi:mono/diheme cytochrome c family protein
MKILKKIEYLFISILFIGGGFILLSMTNDIQDDWPVPAKYKSMENPYAGKNDVDKIGKDLYNQHCKSCHGKEGYGDGNKAGELDTEMKDFTTEAVQSQTDGELYYKTIIGRNEMPNFEKKLPSKEDRWLLVNYLRTLEE